MNTRPSTLVELLQKRALTQPDHQVYTFLVDGEREEISLTHQALARKASAIGTRLIEMGMSGERVLLLYPPGLEYIAAFFGCLCAGAVAVPAYPPRPNRSLQRIHAIVEDAGAKAALTTTRIFSRMASFTDPRGSDLKRLAWLATDDLGEEEFQEGMTKPNELAFLQYTSGSTGKPKGVMLTHRNLLHNAELVRQAMEHAPTDRYVSWLPTFHDMGFMAGILQPLYANVSVVLMSPASFLQNPVRWLQAISRHRATTSGGPNFAYDLCVRRVRPEQIKELDLSCWTVAFNGAEPVREETMNRFGEAFSACGFRRNAFYPCYGLAEATLMVSGGQKSAPLVVHRVDTEALEQNRVVEASAQSARSLALVSSGKALMKQTVVIVHPERLTECAPDEVGEVWVAGESIAGGYWQQAEETKRTLQASLAGSEGTNFLRTGDLGFLEDGDLFITGRLKDLIIIRGLNHYPQDIELSAERSHPELRPQCNAAFGITLDDEERLVIVQEIHSLDSSDMEEVIQSIRRAVAEEHEVQVYAVVLIKPSTIPKTSSGKIQRHACRDGFEHQTLEELARGLNEQLGELVEPRKLTRGDLLLVQPEERQPLLEAYLRELTAQVLKIPVQRLGEESSPTAAGLDSLMSYELKYRLETDLGIVVPQVLFMQDDNWSQLAFRLLSLMEEAAPVAGESARETRAEYPLSPMQQAIWVLCELAPESSIYNVAFAATIDAPVDSDALQNAFQSLIQRHATLRTTFHVKHGEPVQRINGDVQVDYQETDASGWSEQELHQRLLEEANHPFDLERGPVLRARLYSSSRDAVAQEHVLLVSAHHLVMDGWSFWVLLDDLKAFYAAAMTGEKAPLNPLTREYPDFVDWSQRMLAGVDGEHLWSYWQSRLSGELPLLDLPTSRPRPPVQTYPGASHSFVIDAALTSELENLAKGEQATLYMTLLAAFQVLLRRYTGQDEILVGSPISGRNRARFENIVGCFFNVLVLDADLSKDPSFREFLKQVRQTVLGALEHQDYPSHLLAERLQPQRDQSRPPLFQTTFILQKPQRLAEAVAVVSAGDRAGAKTDLPLKLLPLERRFARTELELEMIERDGALFAWFHFNTDLFDLEFIEGMAGHFLNLLSEIVRHPAQRVLSLSLLTDAELGLLVTEWSNAGASIPITKPVQALFEEQAQRNPHHLAAVDGELTLSFGELDAQANQLANLIMELQK